MPTVPSDVIVALIVVGVLAVAGFIVLGRHL